MDESMTTFGIGIITHAMNASMKMFHIGIIVYAIVNIITFALMGIDKRRARKHLYRIPETTLFFFAILGGGLGGTIGMFAFHHKTKHSYFLWGFPLIFIAQTFIIVLLHFI